jgi:hypothetical protein
MQMSSGMRYSLPNPPRVPKFRSVVGAALPTLLAVSLFTSLAPFLAGALRAAEEAAVRAVSRPPKAPVWVQEAVPVAAGHCRSWLAHAHVAMRYRVVPVVVAAIGSSECAARCCPFFFSFFFLICTGVSHSPAGSASSCVIFLRAWMVSFDVGYRGGLSQSCSLFC